MNELTNAKRIMALYGVYYILPCLKVMIDNKVKKKSLKLFLN